MPIHRSRAGFTFVELVVVLAILIVLAGVLVPAADGYIERSRLARAQSDMREIGLAFRRYRQDTGAWPSDAPETTLATAVQELTGFECLYRNAFELQGWDGPYLNRGARVGESVRVATSDPARPGVVDPWGRPYVLCSFAAGYLGAGTPGSLVLLSKGPDGASASSGEELAVGEARGDDVASVVTLEP